MKEINDKFNRNVKISTTYSKEIFDGDTRMRLHYLCVSELQDGRCGVTVTAKSRIFDIWNTLPELFQLKNIHGMLHSILISIDFQKFKNQKYIWWIKKN